MAAVAPPLKVHEPGRPLTAILTFRRPRVTKATVGGLILGIFILVAIFGPLLAPYDPSATIPNQQAPLAPTLHHLLGTTSSGQDVLSQLLVGIRASVVLGLLTGVIATSLAILVGVPAGYLGGWSDEGLSLLTNVFLVLPALPLLIVLLGYLPHAGQVPTAIVLSALGWAWGARVIRAQTLSIRGRDFVAAAREVGEPTWRIILFEILPNEVSLIAASFVGTVLYAILTSVALSFIGVADVSRWSLGTMLYWVQNADAIQVNAWWWYVPPGLCVALLGMSLVLLNFGLDEIGSPRLASTGRRGRSGRAWRPADPTPVIRDEASR
jgi:peptide/nickel transport system permease protein